MILPLVSELLSRVARRPAVIDSLESLRNTTVRAKLSGLTGPAKALVEPTGRIPVVGGRTSVSVRFEEPGTYVLRATADDGALSTPADVTIVVGSGATSRR